MMLTALGIDIMLPAFGEVREHFHLDAIQLLLLNRCVLFSWTDCTKLFSAHCQTGLEDWQYCALVFPLYIIGGVAATFAPSMPVMFASRFVAGVGASAVLMTTIASVRDRFVGDQMARIMSLIFTVFLSTPVFAAVPWYCYFISCIVAHGYLLHHHCLLLLCLYGH
jgi:DHA1 family bicyclomycin/chloramphenicol resistance-like MFS transporter